jgi:hypothetical protein
MAQSSVFSQTSFRLPATTLHRRRTVAAAELARLPHLSTLPLEHYLETIGLTQTAKGD